MPDFTHLLAWQAADRLAHAVYDETAAWPATERYGLTAQLRRAALSIPANIAEGATRRGPREFAHFLDIAMGSHAETRYLLQFGRERGYSTECQPALTDEVLGQSGRLIWGLHRAMRAARK